MAVWCGAQWTHSPNPSTHECYFYSATQLVLTVCTIVLHGMQLCRAVCLKWCTLCQQLIGVQCALRCCTLDTDGCAVLIAHWLVVKGMRCTLSSRAVPLLQTASRCVT